VTELQHWDIQGDAHSAAVECGYPAIEEDETIRRSLREVKEVLRGAAHLGEAKTNR